MKKHFLYFSIISILILPYYISGQIKIHKHLTTEDGLVNNKVMRIIQDSKGYMWFGTFNGISVWDGNNFNNITKNEGLTSPAILDLVEADDGTIFLSTYGKGVIAYKNGNLDTINTNDGLSSNMVFRLKKTNGKILFFSDSVQSYNSGKPTNIYNQLHNFKGFIRDVLWEYDNIYIGSRTNGFYVKDNFIEKHFLPKDGLLSNKVDLFEKDHSGALLIATQKGINKYKAGKLTALKYKGKVFREVITDIVAASDGTNYYSTSAGLLIENNSKVELLTTANGLLDNSIWSLEEDKYGNIYIGYENNGVSIYSPERFSNYVSQDESSKFIANSIIQDNFSNIVLGTKFGITILNSNKHERITTYDGLTNNNVLSMTKNKNGEIYIGTKKGFNILKGKTIKPYFGNDKVYQGIHDIEISPDGDVIMAVRRQGLHIFTPDNQKSTKYLTQLVNTNDTLANKVFKGRENIIFGAKKINSEKVDGGIINHITLQNGLQSSWILDIMFSKDSTLIIGYHGRGVSFYKNGVFKHLRKKDGLSDRIINTITELKDGSIWFGTAQGGITKYHNGIYDTIDTKDGLTSNHIRGIKQIGNKIFVTTDDGLNIITQDGNKYFIRNLKKDDGLLSNDCNRNALYLDNKQNLWIGTTKGVSKFNITADKENTTPPQLYITGIEIFNKKFPLEKFLSTKELKYNQNYLKFIYTGINLSAPEKIKYKYRLSGIDNEWVESIANSAPYTNLDNGNYTFEVKARNEWGYWSEPKTLSFVINPAWWETWWFYSLTVLAIGSLIAFISSYRYRHLLAIEKMRSKISADLHDSVGSGLSEISILAELLNTQISEDKKDFKSALNNISTISRSLIESMSDIVWLVNPKKDTLKDLFNRLQMSYHEVLKYTDIDLLVENLDELETIKLPMNFRQHLYLIFKEAINNAIKYSGGDLLNLKIQTAGNNLTVIFSDNGIGFKQNEKEMGNGLINMKNRAKEIGGKIEYFSEENKGTIITFKGRFSKQKI